MWHKRPQTRYPSCILDVISAIYLRFGKRSLNPVLIGVSNVTQSDSLDSESISKSCVDSSDWGGLSWPVGAHKDIWRLRDQDLFYRVLHPTAPLHVLTFFKGILISRKSFYWSMSWGVQHRACHIHRYIHQAIKVGGSSPHTSFIFSVKFTWYGRLLNMENSLIDF